MLQGAVPQSLTWTYVPGFEQSNLVASDNRDAKGTCYSSRY
jgi:hypothetical protein